MASTSELLKAGKTREVWEKYCGFIDIGIKDFMDIQKNLLLEQLQLFAECDMTVNIMGGVRPTTVEEFRQQVPFTTYKAYMPYLQETRGGILPGEPLLWVRTSGRSGEYPFKWAPITAGLYAEMSRACIAYVILSACRGRYDIPLQEHDKFFYGMAPPPYPTGAFAMSILSDFPLDFVPSPQESEVLNFDERIRAGVTHSLSEGIDFIFGLSSILVAIGHGFAERSGQSSIAGLLRQPRALIRIIKALIKSKLARRDMLPKDLWSIKGVMSAGMDSSIFRERIKHYWGRYPLTCYACAEMGLMAVQTWDFKDMVLVPTMAFYEFIPEEEHFKSKTDRSYQPQSVLADELEPGKRYEIVTTSFHGGPFIRYRIGDMIQVNNLSNPSLNIELPQVTFHSRCDEIIDIGGFTRLTEKVIWAAIEDSRVPYRDWVARKEIRDNPCLHLYLEPLDSNTTPETARAPIHQKLTELDKDYRDVQEMLHFDPLKVTILPRGAFQRYISRQKAAGADLAHLKPPHLNVSDEIIRCLTDVSEF